MAEQPGQRDYVVDNVFPSGYVRPLQPALLSYVAASAGFVPPIASEPFVYLELGCGTGTTLNVLAAANPGSRFIGVDFNPAHVRIARQDAADAGLENIDFIESAFEELSISDLPDCDYIATNGTYSWLPPATMGALNEIIGVKLRSGGLLFLDYLCAPQRLPISPVWFLLREVTRNMEGESEGRVARGMEILRRLNDAGGGYLAQSPSARGVLERNLIRIDEKDPNVLRHLAHHALAEHQDARFFIEIRDEMRRIGLEFCGSSTPWRNDPELCLPPELRDICNEQDDPAIGEMIKDFHVNDTQRKDVFVKGAQRDPEAATDYLRNKCFFLSMRPAAGLLNAWSRNLQPRDMLRRPTPSSQFVLECLDREVTALGYIEDEAAANGITAHQVRQSLDILIARPDFHLCLKAPNRPTEPMPGGEPAISAFNLAARSRAKEAERSNAIFASPVTGAGLTLGPKQVKAFQPHMAAGPSNPEETGSQPPASETVAPEIVRDFQTRILPRLRKLEILA